MPIGTAAFVKQADYALQEYKKLRSRSQHDNCSDQPDLETTRVLNLLAATVVRIAPESSHYRKAVEAIIERIGPTNACSLSHLPGILQAVRDDWEGGRMQTVAEIIHGDLFGDMLEGAAHLREEGWKDPAAVIAGSVLEQHLRELCAKHSKYSINVEKPDGSPKKADTLNSELAAVGAYSKLDQKSVTAWLDLRNKAAHGKYSEYETSQVAMMIDGIRDFVRRCPA
jgi:hypothetical protein